jgi:hypothetical protein
MVHATKNLLRQTLCDSDGNGRPYRRRLPLPARYGRVMGCRRSGPRPMAAATATSRVAPTGRPLRFTSHTQPPRARRIMCRGFIATA